MIWTSRLTQSSTLPLRTKGIILRHSLESNPSRSLACVSALVNNWDNFCSVMRFRQ